MQARAQLQRQMWLSEPGYSSAVATCTELYPNRPPDPARNWCRVPATGRGSRTNRLVDDDGASLQGYCFDCGVSPEAWRIVDMIAGEITTGQMALEGNFNTWPAGYANIRSILRVDYVQSNQELDRIRKKKEGK